METHRALAATAPLNLDSLSVVPQVDAEGLHLRVLYPWVVELCVGGVLMGSLGIVGDPSDARLAQVGDRLSYKNQGDPAFKPGPYRKHRDPASCL